jgi:3',5'-cyclic AMP phosphodiesterase CpdA
MSDSINWLHFTDLHLGLDKQSWLWPRVKHDLLRDLERVGQEIDSWDLVFFTGDLTQSGAVAEFEQLNEELAQIWAVLTKKGTVPKLCVVPGNHDLRRPPKSSAICKAFSRYWWSDPDVRQSFWTDPTSEYRQATNEFFAAYTEWYTRISVPTVSAVAGILPGDFSATFSKGALALGIIGLNSTFLQVTDDDFKGALDIHVSQLAGVCDGDPSHWLSARKATLLLTHHPPSWLAPDALCHFRQEIYPPGRFLAQLCGHQHEPEAFELSEAGAPPRRLRQGPSLFGLEEFSIPNPKHRIHGYLAGQFVFDEANSFETLWPRASVKGRHGGLNIGPDLSFQLNEDYAVVTPFVASSISLSASSERENVEHVHAAYEQTDKPDLPLLDDHVADLEDVPARIASCPKIILTFGPQHALVRHEEQNQFELSLRRTRTVWLVADWGSGKDGFLAATLQRFQQEDNPVQAFHLRCDEASDVDSVEKVFAQQFGMALQAFCSLVAPVRNAFLVLDEIQPELCGGERLAGLQRITKAILDYCPALGVIQISRLAPSAGVYQTVSLYPLEAPDVRVYVVNHPDASADLHEADVIEKLHAGSDGLPMHLDRMLRALKVASLTTVLDSANAFESQSVQHSTPRALVHTVSSLSKSRDMRTRRSFRLLKVLALLPYGESLDTLRYFLPTEPFF